jgi:hypothetical protein
LGIYINASIKDISVAGKIMVIPAHERFDNLKQLTFGSSSITDRGHVALYLSRLIKSPHSLKVTAWWLRDISLPQVIDSVDVEALKRDLKIRMGRWRRVQWFVFILKRTASRS